MVPPPQQAMPPGPPSPLQTVEPKLAQLSVAGEAFGSKCEGRGWDGQGKNLGGNMGYCGQRPPWEMSQPKGIILSGVKEGPRNLQPRPGETQTGMSHLSFISQILETAVCIFGGGGFREGKESGEEDWGARGAAPSQPQQVPPGLHREGTGCGEPQGAWDFKMVLKMSRSVKTLIKSSILCHIL